MRKLLLVLLVAGSMACGSTTKLTNSWFEIGTHFTPGPANKIFVVAMVKNENARRIIEDNLVKRFNSQAVQSYRSLTPEMMKAAKPEALEKYIADGGYTHVVLMRLANVEEETRYVPGMITGYYSGYGAYYAYGANFYSTPGYYTTDKNYFVETTLYSVTPNKLLWTGSTTSENATKVDKTVNQIADLVIDKMTKQGYLVKK